MPKTLFIVLEPDGHAIDYYTNESFEDAARKAKGAIDEDQTRLLIGRVEVVAEVYEEVKREVHVSRLKESLG
jgi:hypothetical protein